MKHYELYWDIGCELLCDILSRVCGNHDVLCKASGCESLCYADPGVWESWRVILRQWMGFTVWTLFQWMWIMERVMLSQWLWITMCYSAPVGVNHGELCWDSDCESCCVILCQYVWLMVCYIDPLVLNHCVFYWASGCEPLWVVMRQWEWMMMCYVEPVGVNDDVVCWANGCELLCAMLSQWL